MGRLGAPSSDTSHRLCTYKLPVITRLELATELATVQSGDGKRVCGPPKSSEGVVYFEAPDGHAEDIREL